MNLSLEDMDIIDVYMIVKEIEHRCNDKKAPRPMPKSYRNSRDFRNIKTLKK